MGFFETDILGNFLNYRFSAEEDDFYTGRQCLIRERLVTFGTAHFVTSK